MSDENQNAAGNPDRGQAFINALAMQRNQAQDSLAMTAAELAVARSDLQRAYDEIAALKSELAGQSGLQK